MEFEVRIYDVIGNNIDGYSVNDITNIIKIDIDDDTFEDDVKLFKALKQNSILKKGLHYKSFTFDGDFNVTYINYSTSRIYNYPFCEVRKYD